MVRVRQILLEEPVLDRRQRHRAGRRPLLGLGVGSAPAGHGRQLSDGLVLEKLLRGEPQARLIGSRDDLDAEDRVAAQLEEVVVDADAARPPAPQPRSSPALCSTGVRGAS